MGDPRVLLKYCNTTARHFGERADAKRPTTAQKVQSPAAITDYVNTSSCLLDLRDDLDEDHSRTYTYSSRPAVEWVSLMPTRSRSATYDTAGSEQPDPSNEPAVEHKRWSDQPSYQGQAHLDQAKSPQPIPSSSSALRMRTTMFATGKHHENSNNNDFPGSTNDGSLSLASNTTEPIPSDTSSTRVSTPETTSDTDESGPCLESLGSSEIKHTDRLSAALSQLQELSICDVHESHADINFLRKLDKEAPGDNPGDCSNCAGTTSGSHNAGNLQQGTGNAGFPANPCYVSGHDQGNKGNEEGDGDSKRPGPGPAVTDHTNAHEPGFCCPFVRTREASIQCQKREKFVSKLKRHLGTHDFWCCHRCFGQFESESALKDHNSGGCTSKCVTSGCQYYGFSSNCQRCRHGTAQHLNSGKAQWEELARMAERMVRAAEADATHVSQQHTLDLLIRGQEQGEPSMLQDEDMTEASAQHQVEMDAASGSKKLTDCYDTLVTYEVLQELNINGPRLEVVRDMCSILRQHIHQAVQDSGRQDEVLRKVKERLEHFQNSRWDHDLRFNARPRDSAVALPGSLPGIITPQSCDTLTPHFVDRTMMSQPTIMGSNNPDEVTGFYGHTPLPNQSILDLGQSGLYDQWQSSAHGHRQSEF